MKPLKTIRSFIQRQRKLLPNKQKILDENWPIYGLEHAQNNLTQALTLEIGFGTGNNLINLALKYPEQNFIGIEVYLPGIVNTLAQLKNLELKNVRIYHEDAVTVLSDYLPNHSLEKILIFFPDPWPKKRHHKRRLIQPEFVALLHKKLTNNGILHFATDWEDYANHTLEIFKNAPNFTQLEPEQTATILADRSPTKFEQRGKNRGHKIFDLVFAAIS